MNVVVHDFHHGLGEIGQSTRAKMAMCRKTKDGFETCHQLAKCKDFLHDAAACVFMKDRTSHIYGFQYNPKTMPKIDTDAIRVFVTGITGDDAMTSYKILSDLAEMAGFDKVILSSCSEGFVFEGDKRWLDSPAAISLFTGLMRMGQYGPIPGTSGEWLESLKGKSGNDPSYVTQVGGAKAFDKMIALLNDEKISWAKGGYEKLDRGALHHGCGWVAYCAGLYAKSVGDGSFPVKR